MKKILIIRLTSLGDVIFTIPLACTLKNNDKNTKIGWLVAEKGIDIIKTNPCVDNYHFVPIEKWKKNPFSLATFKEFFTIIKEIRKEKYDIALDCQQMFKSMFLFLFCGAKRRITFKHARELSVLGGNEFVKPKVNFRDFNYHIVERNLDFARHLGIEPEKIEFCMPEPSQNVKNKIDDLLKNLDKVKPIIVIAPATTWKNKHWAEQNWADVINSIHSKCNLIFTGTNTDKELIARILEKTDGSINYTNLVGKTNIEDLTELFSRTKLVISPDSGSTHLAWANGSPAVIAIFTCTPPHRFGPYGNNTKYFAIGANLHCQPCFKKRCPLQKEKNFCQNYPKSDVIIKIVNNLL
ncbi:MAG: glycosyltransferase family 9 protein [bacterium]